MLAGITVLDLSTVGPAARASRWLADYGARVVKVGAPEGLQIEPPFYAYSAHRGMEHVGIDLKSSDGLAAFLDLVDSADVLIESFRPGVVDRLGIGYDALKGRNPRLVYGCADGGWLTVAAIEPRFWANLCKALGLERWIEHQTDDDVQDEIRGELAAVFRTRSRDEWVAELGPADTCVAAVLSVPEVVDDEQYASRGAFVEASDPDHGAFRQVGYVLAGSAQ